MLKKNNQPINLTQRALSFWGGILILWSFYRSQFKLSIEFDELLIKPLIFISPVIFFIKSIEKKPVLKSLWLEGKKLISDLILFCGMVLFLFLFFFLLKNIKLINFTIITPQNFWKLSLINIFTALSENILSLGFVLKKLYEEKNNFLSSIFLSATLYFILRIPALFTQPNLMGSILLYTLIVSFLLNLGLGILFLIRKSLWLPILIHFLYLTSLQIILF